MRLCRGVILMAFVAPCIGLPAGRSHTLSTLHASDPGADFSRQLERREEPVVRKVIMESQHAHCPDDQCPRARVFNVGYVGLGYNLVYGNPWPAQGGIDPGFKNFGGGAIFQITYEHSRETTDGRQEVPDYLDVLAENGCTLQMSMQSASTSNDYMSMVRESSSYSGSIGIKAFSASASASGETLQARRDMEGKDIKVTYSTAMCDTFRINMNHYEGRPAYTDFFKQQAHKCKDASEGDASDAAWFDLFDIFGTHFQQGMTLGSKFALRQTYRDKVWERMRQEKSSSKTSAEIGLALEFKKQKDTAKAKAAATGGCAQKTSPLRRANALRRKDKTSMTEAAKDPCATSKMDWVKESIGLLMDKVGKLEVGANVKMENEEETQSEESASDESESREMISIGASPSEDIVEWAQESHEEAMPIKYSLVSICELFDAWLPTVLKPHKQSHDMLGGIAPEASKALKARCEKAHTDYCPKRVQMRDGRVECEPEVVRKAHTCNNNKDCNHGDSTQYRCVDKTCKLPYVRVVDLQLLQGFKSDSCPSGYEPVMVSGEDIPADLGDAFDSSRRQYALRLCMLKKDASTDASTRPVCEVFLGGALDLGHSGTSSRHLDGLKMVHTTKCKSELDNTRRCAASFGETTACCGVTLGSPVDDSQVCLESKPACVGLKKKGDDDLELGHCTTEKAYKSYSCKPAVGTPDAEALPSQIDDSRFLYYEQSSCENFVEEMKCEGVTKYTSCDPEDVGTSNSRGTQNNCKIPIKTSQSGYCKCKTKTGASQSWQDRPNFFCGHHEEVDCNAYCKAAVPRTGVSDIVAVRSLTACPAGYSPMHRHSVSGDLYDNLESQERVAGAGQVLPVGKRALYLCVQHYSPEGTQTVEVSLEASGNSSASSSLERSGIGRAHASSQQRVVPAARTGGEPEERRGQSGGLVEQLDALEQTMSRSLAEEDVPSASAFLEPLDDDFLTSELAQEDLPGSPTRMESLATSLGLEGGADANPETKVIVHSQHANCPDAQCPAAKVINLGYIAKGYNLLYAHPHPKESGVDPGFSHYGGGTIFNLTYSGTKSTGDGRYIIPDLLDVVSEKGCSLSFSSKDATSASEYNAMMRDSLSVGASLSVGPFFSSSFRASGESQGTEKILFSGTHTAVKSEARCSAFGARFIDMTDVKFSTDFLAGLKYLEAVGKGDAEGVEPAEAWFDFFDTFGTHFLSAITLGSRYSFSQIFESSSYDKLRTKEDKASVSADVAVGIGWFSASASYSKETESQGESARRSGEMSQERSITSLGAPPSETEIEWARESQREAMPIDVVPSHLCGLLDGAHGTGLSGEQSQLVELDDLAALKEACDKYLSFDEYCTKRIAPRSGMLVCSGIHEDVRTSVTCQVDSDCGAPDEDGNRLFECTSTGICARSYDRVVDMHLAFQTPCRKGQSVEDAHGKPFDYEAHCDGTPICEPGYVKVKKVGSDGKPIADANLNEHLAALPESDQLDTYVIHLCVRKTSATMATFKPLHHSHLHDYGDREYGKGFPVCSAFLSKAADLYGDRAWDTQFVDSATKLNYDECETQLYSGRVDTDAWNYRSTEACKGGLWDCAIESVVSLGTCDGTVDAGCKWKSNHSHFEPPQNGECGPDDFNLVECGSCTSCARCKPLLGNSGGSGNSLHPPTHVEQFGGFAYSKSTLNHEKSALDKYYQSLGQGVAHFKDLHHTCHSALLGCESCPDSNTKCDDQRAMDKKPFLSRVQGVVGCLQRGPGKLNQQHVGRGLLSASQAQQCSSRFSENAMKGVQFGHRSFSRGDVKWAVASDVKWCLWDEEVCTVDGLESTKKAPEQDSGWDSGSDEEGQVFTFETPQLNDMNRGIFGGGDDDDDDGMQTVDVKRKPNQANVGDFLAEKLSASLLCEPKVSRQYAHHMFSSMGGASNVNLGSAKCHESMIFDAPSKEQPAYAPLVTMEDCGQDNLHSCTPTVKDLALQCGRDPHFYEGAAHPWPTNPESEVEELKARGEYIRAEQLLNNWHLRDNIGYRANAGVDPSWEQAFDGTGFETTCTAQATPKFLWFQSSTCEVQEAQMTCKSLTKVQCDNHKVILEEVLCDEADRKAEIAENEAGFCTCIVPETKREFVQPMNFICGAHAATSCQEYCIGQNPPNAVTDMVVVSSADVGGKDPTCPLGYVRVKSINKQVGQITGLDDNLNQGRNADHFPTLFLCQTYAWPLPGDEGDESP